MGAGHYSVEASIYIDGKITKGVLTLFYDEYVFGSSRTPVNWEKVTCEQGMEKLFYIFRTVEKPYVVFHEGDQSSPKFVLEPDKVDVLLKKVKEFADAARSERLEKEKKAREEERKLREEARKKAEEIIRKQKEAELRSKAAKSVQPEVRDDKILIEKRERIRKEVEACNARQEQLITTMPISLRAASLFLDNPYRILGISCLADALEANSALDKLKKLSRLKALGSYQSPFDLNGISRPVRDLSIAQNALMRCKELTNRFFWFAEPDACKAWQSGRYRIELTRDGEEHGSYDLFLANYLYAIMCDPDFNISETWKRILKFYCYICRQSSCELLRSRFAAGAQGNISNAELLEKFRSVIFKPLLLLCERDDLEAVLRIHNYIRDCNDRLLSGLGKDILGKLVSWFTDKEADSFDYLREIDKYEYLSAEQGDEITKRGEAYCNTVEPVLETVLRQLSGDKVRHDMIRESFRHTVYQFMYELNKCPDKSSAIMFANKCYNYCNADDKKRIRFTFGEANVKAIDWGVPHTIWDAKGDNYYYGRGCKVDYGQAMYWYRQAADAGNMYSMNSIAECYKNGHGVPQDDEQAALWYEKACRAGNPQGAFHLAECYYSGTGVRRNIDQALKYWSEAARLGHPSAAARREEIFAGVQEERRKQRANSHLLLDVGFQMTTGPAIAAEVTLSRPAYVYLVNMQGYQNYVDGKDFKSYGGYASSSPHLIRIPSSNHWYLIVDNGGDPVNDITASVRVKRL